MRPKMRLGGDGLFIFVGMVGWVVLIFENFIILIFRVEVRIGSETLANGTPRASGLFIFWVYFIPADAESYFRLGKFVI